MKQIKDMGVPPQQPTKEQLELAYKNGHFIECDTENCHGKIFLPAIAFRHLSRIALGTSEDKQMPVDVLVCAKCGSVMDDMDGDFK